MDELEAKTLLEIARMEHENRDSIEYGGVAKTGKIDVHGDASRPEEFKVKVDAMIALLKHAVTEINKNQQG